jgi:hypothetical protein
LRTPPERGNVFRDYLLCQPIQTRPEIERGNALSRRRNPLPEPKHSEIDELLVAMDAAELREVVRDVLLELDDRAHMRVVTSLIERAARGKSGWVPSGPGRDEVAEVVAFAKAAQRVGYADPRDVDERLSRGSAAFFRKAYSAARGIFGALLRPLAEGEIDLGQHELVDEVLGVEPSMCAGQYVVSIYMTSKPEQRPEAVRAAIAEVDGLGYFLEPILELERVAVEPLPGLDDFLPRWRAVVVKEAAAERGGDWDTQAQQWLHEVVRRTEGASGLEKIARSTRHAGDLRAWCESLIELGDWKAALAALEDSAELVTDKNHTRGELLDGAALAAQQLGRKDLSPWLERAWRAAPTMLRLRRWLGSARGKAAIRRRAAEAFAACPKQAHRQRAFLHVLHGDFDPAAKLLASAPGLGWSDSEHPGHLLFHVFRQLLGVGPPPSRAGAALQGYGLDIDEVELFTADRDEPRLAAPEAGEIVRRAGIESMPDGKARAAVLAAMRKAAERRVAGVTEQKRRRHYGHAAELVAACLACDESPEAARWATTVRQAYRRFPALRAEFEERLGSS